MTATVRLAILAGCFLATTTYLQSASQAEQVPLRAPLSTMPWELDGWRGRPAPPLAESVEAVLGVDEYVNRYYDAAAGGAVALYIGYYGSQRQGDTIHSPMNCLPGAGWQPVETTRVDFTVPDRAEPIRVNQVLIEKGLDRQLVLYWYQSHNRVIASEYWSKIFLVTDAIRLNRSDAALVRVVTPAGATTDDRAAAAHRLQTFVQAIFPVLGRFLPS